MQGGDVVLTLDRAKEINDTMVTGDQLRIHAMNVMASMGAMAEHFGENKEIIRNNKMHRRLSK